ncbi:hypothetical protein M427DRAFT_401089 [Gonapodya prolifera JEL478]|uniref:Uncharacterized protein n=1 Tax=Gonapodya prolifera (strain JEL478) TaxID=1344416 RepID=A0A139AU84_GONPJ|nr:hypothetical protein M427DRAFT_401089 [Gonapodya prolifera JEL478]|eukprot:KXS20055.1 hypothetical protein M427DRAFT_401089 [Gonapodya prolifera JEL478]
MMPILANNLSRTLPAECKDYLGIIYECVGQLSGVMYLTIDERSVPVGEAHRRPGLHCESPVVTKKEHPLAFLSEVGGDKFRPFFRWGRGVVDRGSRTKQGGIYLASTVAHSSRVYPNVVLNASMAGKDGALGEIRYLLGPPHDLEESRVYWMTDRTPHESLPLQGEPGQTVYRQFFRLVAGPIDVWFSKHNTPSPFGVKPDCPISDIYKFSDDV